MSLSVFKYGFIFTCLFALAVNTTIQAQTPVFVDSSVILVDHDTIHVATLKQPKQNKSNLFFVQQGTVIANANLMVLTGDFKINQLVIDANKTVKTFYTYKNLDKNVLGHAPVPPQMVSSPLGTSHGYANKYKQGLVFCVADQNSKTSFSVFTIQRLAITLQGFNSRKPAFISTTFLYQRSPLEKHNRYFNLPPPAAV